MSRHATRFNKRDQVEPAILRALEQMGVSYYTYGPLDIWAHIDGHWIPCEIKTGNAPLTAGQKEFLALCVDRGWRVCVWRTPEEAIECVQASKEVA